MTACQLPVIYLDHMADRDGHAVVPAASGNDPELDSIERWPDVGRMAAGRRTPQIAALPSSELLFVAQETKAKQRRETNGSQRVPLKVAQGR